VPWALPEDVPSGAQVGLVLAWFPHPQVEYTECCKWREGDPAPDPPQDYIFGEWRPSPCFETHRLMRNYKVVPAVAGLFQEGDFVSFFARGQDWLVPKGTPQAVMIFDEEVPHTPHEPPAHLR
jgi:hypothetical protein